MPTAQSAPSRMRRARPSVGTACAKCGQPSQAGRQRHATRRAHLKDGDAKQPRVKDADVRLLEHGQLAALQLGRLHLARQQLLCRRPAGLPLRARVGEEVEAAKLPVACL